MPQIRRSSAAPIATGRLPQSPAELAALLRRLSRRERRARFLLWLWATFTLLWLLPLGPLSAAHLPAAAAVAIGGGSLAVGALLVGLYRLCSRPRSLAGPPPRREKAAYR